MAERFVKAQEERFSRALERVLRIKDEMVFVPPDLLEFGDVSDFSRPRAGPDGQPSRPRGGPRAAARRRLGRFHAELAAGLAGRITGLLKDGRKVRGGATAMPRPSISRPTTTPTRSGRSLLSALRTAREADRPVGLSLGDLLKEKLNGK
ncbi:MAG: hypothetical protein M0C28_00110 [Candidatus Moduliflexus flocculans]|nr:hypothetical protein [Candidatus Moduliflexus flocculans]